MTTGYVDPTLAFLFPRETQANLIRAQWEDFVNTALPVRDDLMKMTTYAGNTGVVGELKEQGAANVANSFATTTGTAARQQSHYGMAADPTQQAALDRSAALSKAAALAGVDNDANRFQADLNRQIVAGMGSMAKRDYAA